MDCKKDNDMFRMEWNDRPIVRVLGTVMTRDDTLGGWVPYMNGGQSKIGIHESTDKRRYRIYGWRMSDKKVTLDCLIQRNMVFHETIGTFHHWKVGDNKMGLTFYTPAEARSFNRGVRFAREQLSRVPEYSSSSASSMCGRLSDEHPSSCTSPASSTGSSSPCEHGAFSSHRTVQESCNKHSTSTASSSSSRRGNRRGKSPAARPGKPIRVTHNSTSSSTSIQNRSHGHHPAVVSVASAAPSLSLLSSTASPRYCDTPSSCDVGQSHFRWPLPQQQGYSANLTFLRPLPQDGSPYELTSFSLPSHHTTVPSREGDFVSTSKPQAPLPGPEDPNSEESTKSSDLSVDCHRASRPPATHRRESAHSRGRDNRRTSPHQGRHRTYQHHQRPRHTKTPHLDDLERQRDLKPTEPNSYVFFSSSKPTTTTGSQRISRGLSTGMTTTLSGIRTDYKPLGMIDGYQYPSILSRRMCSQYQPPQTGTLSIMASNDTSNFYNRSDLLYSSNIDSIKDDVICYEARSSLISSPKKSKYKMDYYGDGTCDNIDHDRDSDDSVCCCPCIQSIRSRRKTSKSSRQKEDLAERSRCRHCSEMFIHELNRPGSCREAPDKCLHAINKVSCMFCVHSVFYHCCRDEEGDYDNEPCSCSGREGGGTKLARRWSALAALSIIFPCLCLYPPLKACHSCGVACHWCGGKHQAPFPSTKSSSKQKHSRR